MVKERVFGRICVAITAFLVAFSAPMSTYALSEAQLDMFAQNNILFYDPDDGCIEADLEYATAASSFKNLSGDQVAFVETYHDIAVVNSINYGIPWETVVAQGILESASGTSNFAKERNNFFGIGAYDSNPDNAYSYSTPEEGWEGYYKNIKETATYREHGVFAGKTITDPYAYLEAIKAAGYATDPNYVTKVSALISGIEALSKDKGWKSSVALAMEHPEWSENAENNRNGAKAETVVKQTYTVCGGSASLVSGGMTLEEAKEFMRPYAEEAKKYGKNSGNVKFEGALVHDSGCIGGPLNNCSAFTQWFLNRYTTLGDSGDAGIYQGSQAVKKYLARHSELIDGGKVPRVYAIMSQGPYTGSQDGWSNHTTIVLGIDEANNTMIIGEADCSNSFAPRARQVDLKKYTNNPSNYGPTYAYTDNVLKGF